MSGGEVIGSIGGGLSGLLLAVIVAWGLKDRLKRVEDDHGELKRKVVYRDTCTALHAGMEKQFDGLKELIASNAARTDKRLDEQGQKLDRLLEHQNGGRPRG